MIIGTGIDIIEIDRIKRIIKKWNYHFLNKVYTLDEIYYCKQRKEGCFQSFTGYFAAKEAWAKAIGTGIYGIKWKEIEIRKEMSGKPYIHLSGQAKKMAIERRIINTNLSITHNRQWAIAQVIVES